MHEHRGRLHLRVPLGDRGGPVYRLRPQYDAISSGPYHTCARRVDGAVFCFGNGGSGRLGNGQGVHQPGPVQAGAASNWERFAGGGSHTCGIKETGTLWCWGANNFGQLGIGGRTLLRGVRQRAERCQCNKDDESFHEPLRDETTSRTTEVGISTEMALPS